MPKSKDAKDKRCQSHKDAKRAENAKIVERQTRGEIEKPKSRVESKKLPKESKEQLQ
jgi:hypothetical protein